MGVQVETEYRGCLRRVDSSGGRRVVWADQMGSSLSTTCLDVIEEQEDYEGVPGMPVPEEEDGGEHIQPCEPQRRSHRRNQGHWLVSPHPGSFPIDSAKGKAGSYCVQNNEAMCQGCVIL